MVAGMRGDFRFRISDFRFGSRGRQFLLACGRSSGDFLLLGFFFRPRLAVLAADHGDAAGADELQDAVGAHPLDEGLDLALAAGDFDHQLLWAYIDDFCPENLDQLANLGPLWSG